MGIKTTVIGAFPKPEYLDGIVRDWFNSLDSTETFNLTCSSSEKSSLEDDEKILDRATREVIAEQINMGIDLPTDGEIRRENYIHYLCRFITGITFDTLHKKHSRKSTKTQEFACYGFVPIIVGPVSLSDRLDVVKEWKLSQQHCTNLGGSKLKYTLPGPMTIIDSVADTFYKNNRKLGEDLSRILRECVLKLVDAGCTDIQIDEPLIVRQVDDALEWGIELVNNIVLDLPNNVSTTIHICCGYPKYMDQSDYLKADKDAYLCIAPSLAQTSFTAISIEDAHNHNDFEKLLPLFKDKIIVLGCVTIAQSNIETVEQITQRIEEALKYIDKNRLIISPDCGLGFFQKQWRYLLYEKLKNMVAAARLFATKDK